MVKDFDVWNEIKKKVDEKEIDRDFFFLEREIWWCTLGLNVGIEADGKHESFERPVLIIKKFNSFMIWIIPLTGKPYGDKYHVKVHHGSGISWACVSQMKTISTKRLMRKIWTINQTEFDQIREMLTNYLKNETPTKCGGISEAEATNEPIINDSKSLSN